MGFRRDIDHGRRRNVAGELGTINRRSWSWNDFPVSHHIPTINHPPTRRIGKPHAKTQRKRSERSDDRPALFSKPFFAPMPLCVRLAGNSFHDCSEVPFDRFRPISPNPHPRSPAASRSLSRLGCQINTDRLGSRNLGLDGGEHLAIRADCNGPLAWAKGAKIEMVKIIRPEIRFKRNL
jgi:hypothetical protein